jgi:hypothetical protein
MPFRNALARLGAGGATVDTVLDTPQVSPGGTVAGRVHLAGGKVEQEVTEVRVSLEGRVEVESGDSEWREDVTFGTAPVAGATPLEPGQRQSVPFRLPVPWECPITMIDGWHLRGMHIGVQTRVDIARCGGPGRPRPGRRHAAARAARRAPRARRARLPLPGRGRREGAHPRRRPVVPPGGRVRPAPGTARADRRARGHLPRARAVSTSCSRPTGAGGCSRRAGTRSADCASTTATPTRAGWRRRSTRRSGSWGLGAAVLTGGRLVHSVITPLDGYVRTPPAGSKARDCRFASSRRSRACSSGSCTRTGSDEHAADPRSPGT